MAKRRRAEKPAGLPADDKDGKAFRARLFDLIEAASRKQACPLCVLADLTEAVGAILTTFQPTAQQLAQHGLGDVDFTPSADPPPGVTRH
jgi:hypothetical protein